MSFEHVYPFVCLLLLIKDRLHGAMTICQMTMGHMATIHVRIDNRIKCESSGSICQKAMTNLPVEKKAITNFKLISL
jgi:hypothetical protein